MKTHLVFAVLLLFASRLHAQTSTESCQFSVVADGSLKVTQCEPALAAPYMLTIAAVVSPVTVPPPSTLADNRYCDKTGHWTGPRNENGVLAPTACFYTGSDATPSANPPTILKATDDLTKAYAAALCGDVLRLAPGSQYTLTALPAKQCDDAHWITIRSDAADTILPTEGVRITPCAIGLASLPARPSYPCATPAKNLPKIVVASLPKWSGDHVRFIGIEFARTPGYAKVVYGLAQISNANKLIFDRCIFHGDPSFDTVRGLLLGDSSTNIAVIDSYFYDFHCEAMGSCGDAQAISGGISNGDQGPYKIVNDYLEASTENVLFGGGGGNATPHDIEFRRNHLFKPLTWMAGAPGFVGGPTGRPFIVKNLFELKNGERVYVEGVIGENTWGGYSQVGAAVLLTPKNQAGGGTSLCPGCYVRDVIVHASRFSHMAQFLQIADAANDIGAFAKEGHHYSFSNLIFDDLQYPGCYQCGNYIWQIGSGNDPAKTDYLHDVTFDHLTALVNTANAAWFSNGGTLLVGAFPGLLPSNINITNSIVPIGAYDVWSTGGGPAVSCSAATPTVQTPADKFNACWKPYTFAGNVLYGMARTPKLDVWPANNQRPATLAAVGFVNPGGGDYHLAATSSFKGKGTNNSDPGANVDVVNVATAGVE